MRFAYIDSQGNEVAIPSVEALGLRIELGAIGPDTELYDAQTERWGPAHTHEIYHTLSRDSSDGGGFVAPPPPVAPSPKAEEPTVPVAEAPSGPVQTDRPPKTTTAKGDAGATKKPPAAAARFGDDLGFELTLADELAQAPPAASAGPSGAAAPESDAAESTDGEEPAHEGEARDLDGLDLEPTALQTPEPSTGSDAETEPADAGVMDFSPEAEPTEGLDLEPPLSMFTAEGPPAWLEQTGPAAEEEPDFMRFDVLAEEEDAGAPPPRRPPSPAAVGRIAEGPERPARPEPRSRPSPPRRGRRRSPLRFIGGLLTLGIVGAAGYYGWTTLQRMRGGGGDGDAATARPAVVIPHIPEELVPVMQETGEAALDATLSEIRRIPAEMKLPAEPRNDWLAGIYLANASRFPDIEAYWVGIEGFVDRARDEDARIFHEQYRTRLGDAGITGDTAAMLLARADSGFVATRSDRFEAYAEMDDLVNAALDLHQFLLRNEADIQYAPAAGGLSSDPVLEAVPVTKTLGDEMWGMVDRITEALDALGTLDRVTTDRLVGALIDRLRVAGFK